MAGTFLQSFMICLQRLDQSGSPVAAEGTRGGESQRQPTHPRSPPQTLGSLFIQAATPPALPPPGPPKPLQSPTWIILLEVGEVHVGVEHGGDGGELAQLLVLLPALQAALVVGQPVPLALRRGRRGGRGGGGGRAAGPGALGLAVIRAEEAAPLPGGGAQGVTGRARGKREPWVFNCA